ncbi:MAG: hypothetical protein AB8G05_26245 [Oligoflexales bacterium]
MKRQYFKPLIFSILASSSILTAVHGWASEKVQAKNHVIKNSFETVEQIKAALREERLESSDLIIGIDFTGSNSSQGKKTFHKKNLHSISKSQRNPYQAVIEIMSKTLDEFDDDGIYPAYIFGDAYTQNHSVKPLTDSMPQDGLMALIPLLKLTKKQQIARN